MGDGKNSEEYSRRRFLRSGGALLASGVIGGIAVNSIAQSKPVTGKPPAFPWPWAKLDPMEAGSRAYRYYLDSGG